MIVWSVFVTNRGDGALGTVETYPDLPLITGDVDSDGSLDPGETWQYEYSYTVTEAEAVQELDAITKTVTVTAGDHTASTTMSVDTKWLNGCDFVGDTLPFDETNPADAMGPCYYGFEKGYWKLTLTPTGDIGRKPLSLSMTMRDGVPGNWCSVRDPETGDILEGSAVASTQWRAGYPPLELYVEFPADGVCLQGGAGGETIAVNNPNIFFLAAWGFSEGTVTATKCDSLTIQNGTITGCNQ